MSEDIWQVATCEHCKKVTDISNSKWVMKMMVQNRTLKDFNRNFTKNYMNTLAGKNGVIESLHHAIKNLMDLMTEKQIKKAKQINQYTRDSIKKAEK